MQQKAGRRREMCNTGRTFISSVTSSNFHWHNVTPFARPMPLPSSLFLDLLSRNRGFVLEDPPGNGLLFRRHRLSTSSFASLTINLPTGPFIRSPREQWSPGSIIAVVSTQQKSMRVRKNRTTHKTAPCRA